MTVLAERLAEAMCRSQEYCDGTCPDVEGAWAIHGKEAAAILDPATVSALRLALGDELGEAWREVEAALLEGWWLDGLYCLRRPEGDRWEAVAREHDWQGGEDDHVASGPTPAAALTALARRLRDG